MNTLVRKIFPYNLIFISITGLLFTNIPLYIIWILNIFTCSIYVRIAVKYNQNYPADKHAYFLPYFFWSLICIIRGVFIADDYWQWKALLGNTFQMLLPLFIYTYITPKSTAILMRNLLKYGLLLSPILISLAENGDFLGRYFSFFYLYMILLFLLPTKWKITVIIIAIATIIFNIEARSSVIRTVISLAICCIYYLHIRKIKIPLLIHSILMILPFVLVTVGILNIFNPFKFEKYINIKDSTTNNELLADTRTGLYEEIIHSSIKKNYILQGRTPARGYETNIFAIDTYNAKKMNIKIQTERIASEVSILNIYTYYGIIGVLLYFFIFYKASYLALYKSNNFCVQLIGIFIIFRWYYAWVEDFTNFDINYATLWIMIAICFSYKFRNMTNKEFKHWLWSSLPFGNKQKQNESTPLTQ